MKVIVVHILAQLLRHGPVALVSVHHGGQDILLAADDLHRRPVRFLIELLGELVAAMVIEVS